MELSPWEARSRLITQEHSNILCSPKVHCPVHKSRPIFLNLNQTNPVHPTPSYLCRIHFNIIRPRMSDHFYWSLPFWSSHQNTLCIPVHFHVCYIACLPHPPWVDYSNCIWRRVQVTKLLIEHFLQPPVTSSLFGPNILLNTLFSNTLSLCSSLNVRDQVSYPYKATTKIIILYILNFSF
jgi:hypothetical protein